MASTSRSSASSSSKRCSSAASIFILSGSFSSAMSFWQLSETGVFVWSYRSTVAGVEAET